MPIYEYLCAKCETEFEREQRITDDPVKTCPACRSRRVKRLISQTSFVLKGSGWYADGYGNQSDSKKSDDSSTSDAKGETGDDSKKSGKSSESSPSEGKSSSSSDSDGSKKPKKPKKSGKAAA